MNEFSNLSISITKKLSKKIKKENGIFLTPKSIINELINNLPKKNYTSILEPSCGTCEFINVIDKIFENVKITGIELNEIIYNEIKVLKYNNNVNLINNDFLQYNDLKYDLIIGNPPYVVCDKKIVNKKYEELIIGRPNLFGLFIIHSLHLLNDNGICAFIIPKSFLNSHYYSNIRNFIINNYNLIKIIDFENNNNFIETSQSTIGIIIQNNRNNLNNNYSLLINENNIFSCNINNLKILFENSTTLKNMGLSVKTGNIVWNQKKDLLTNDNNKTLLIYNSNITSYSIILKKFNNDEKKQYINMDGNNEPIIVINRGNGNSSYNLTYCLIENNNYLIENHLNVIYSKEKISKKKLIKKFNIILKSLENEKTKLFIKEYLCNNGLSKTELETIFPIYLD